MCYVEVAAFIHPTARHRPPIISERVSGQEEYQPRCANACWRSSGLQNIYFFLFVRYAGFITIFSFTAEESKSALKIAINNLFSAGLTQVAHILCNLQRVFST
ncbi:unnamed protein product [Parnassius mnemosyne]|uniref:Uncharacterized protein n=1 Tax=Parnassius mnemosyne TaxID=213953 RepID=A0AAV1LF28_9NEOP